MTTTEDENKELVRRYLDAFNDWDKDTLDDLVADDVVEHGAHEELHGFDEIVDFLGTYREVFPDYAGSTEAMIAEGDTVAVRYRVSGTHTGEYRDVHPTGHTAKWSGMAMYRIEDGEVAEIWIEEDRLGMLETLEVVDPEHAHLRV